MKTETLETVMADMPYDFMWYTPDTDCDTEGIYRVAEDGLEFFIVEGTILSGHDPYVEIGADIPVQRIWDAVWYVGTIGDGPKAMCVWLTVADGEILFVATFRENNLKCGHYLNSVVANSVSR